jgi:hypothetical protein
VPQGDGMIERSSENEFFFMETTIKQVHPSQEAELVAAYEQVLGLHDAFERVVSRCKDRSLRFSAGVPRAR